MPTFPQTLLLEVLIHGKQKPKSEPRLCQTSIRFWGEVARTNLLKTKPGDQQCHHMSMLLVFVPHLFLIPIVAVCHFASSMILLAPGYYKRKEHGLSCVE